jgi:hypothetical protein
MRATLLWGIAVVGFLFAPVQGQVLRVDSAAANQPETYRTIQEAVDKAPDNGEILIKGGTSRKTFSSHAR